MGQSPEKSLFFSGFPNNAILHTCRYDNHWKPYSHSCSVCFLPYNYILHFENIEQEEKMLIHHLGAEKIIKSRKENVDKDSEDMAREKLIFKYLNILDDDEITSLYKIYENDFKMFNYTFQFRSLRFNL